ncbi:MAG: bacterial proteasome activator family protein [Actinobacteria bacterium]|nr:bacterial proteasome activator family protein [Actinomycetota bacterium]
MTDDAAAPSQTSGQPDDSSQSPEGAQRVIVVGPDGQPIGTVETPATGEDDERNITELVEQPAKVMRIGSMIKQLLDEVRSAPLDAAARARLRDIHARSVQELGDALAPELVEELERLSLPFSGDAEPSEPELRIAQAQLVGWLEGLFHGIQTALFAQQMAARAQLEEMRRRAIGPGGVPFGQAPTAAEQPGEPGPPTQRPPSGPYL